MADEAVILREEDEYLNTIYYGMAKQLLNELLEKELISQSEFYQIDDLNRVSFHQIITCENK
ncbi:SHOCT domain-containing protein [Erysipelotrichaceae bacterium HCN-30851]